MSDDAPARGEPRVALIGLGNALRGDDAIGPLVAARVRDRLRALGVPGADHRLDLRCGALDPLAIIAAWSGATTAVVIDAAVSGAPPGTVLRFDVTPRADSRAAPLPAAFGRASSHGLGLAEAIALARALGRLPPRLLCFAVEGSDFAHAGEMSRPVRAAATTAVERIADEILRTWHHRQPPPPPNVRDARGATE